MGNKINLTEQEQKFPVRFRASNQTFDASFGGTFNISVGKEDAQTYILVTPDGQEIPAVVVDEKQTFTATDNDVREGISYVSDSGASVGTKVIPAYHVTDGYRLITQGSVFVITQLEPLNKYDFTKLQAIICPFAGSINKSVAAEKVAINENVYAVNSSEAIAAVTRDSQTKTINLGITNTSGIPYVLRYFTYKEIY